MLPSSAYSLWSALGRCPKCMRKAFLATFAAWAIAIITVAVSGSPWAVASTTIAALGLTALWLAHIWAFALRTTKAPQHAASDLSVSGPPQTVPAPFSRRQFTAKFARMATFAVVTSALSMSVGKAFATGTCDCSKCTSYCCPTANGYCGCFPFPCP